MTNRNPAAPYLSGSFAGLSVAVAMVAAVAGGTSITTVTSVSASASHSASELTATGSLLGLVVLLAGAVGGFLVSAVTYAMGRTQDPDTSRLSFAVIAPVGILLPAVLSFAVVSLGVTLFGTSADGVVVVPVVSFVVVAAIAGLISGTVTVPIVDGLARHSAIGDANEATPSSATAFWLDLGRAVGVPALAIAVGALLAIGLAQILLNVESTVVTVGVFAAAGALVLGGTALLALRPWDNK